MELVALAKPYPNYAASMPPWSSTGQSVKIFSYALDPLNSSIRVHFSSAGSLPPKAVPAIQCETKLPASQPSSWAVWGFVVPHKYTDNPSCEKM